MALAPIKYQAKTSPPTVANVDWQPIAKVKGPFGIMMSPAMAKLPWDFILGGSLAVVALLIVLEEKK
jgi:hypothetical protein